MAKFPPGSMQHGIAAKLGIWCFGLLAGRVKDKTDWKTDRKPSYYAYEKWFTSILYRQNQTRLVNELY
jgi:hypothetical protein